MDLNGSSPQCLCGICFDYKQDSNMFTGSKCKHPFCSECISKHVVAQIQQSNVVKVNCPNPDCCVELEPEHLNPILPKQVVDGWESARRESLSCKELQKMSLLEAEKDSERKFLELAKREMWQRCPKCNIYVERSSGCEHIKCRCECNFCYHCGKDWMHGHICDNP